MDLFITRALNLGGAALEHAESIMKVVKGVNGQDVTRFIQKALDVGGHIKIQSDVPVEYLISDTLWIDDDTTLELSDSVTIKQKSGTNKYMLRNKGSIAGRRNRNINILGGTWDYNKAGNPTKADWKTTPGHAIFLWKVDNVRYEDMKVINAMKYAFLTVDGNGVFADNIQFNTGSDGLHFQPPMKNVEISNIRGTTHDDMISFTIGDYSTYSVSNEGDFENINIRNVNADGCLCILKITGAGKNQAYQTRNVTVDNISGTTTSPFISIYDDVIEGNTDLLGTRVYGLKVRGANVGAGNTLAQIYMLDGDVEFEDIVSANRTPALVTILDNASLRYLRFSNVICNTQLLTTNAGTRITDIVLENWIKLGNNSHGLSSRSEVKTVTIKNARIENPVAGNRIYFHEKSASATKPKFTFEDCDFINVNDFLNTREAVDLTVNNCRSSKQMNVLVLDSPYTSNAANSVRVDSKGLIFDIAVNTVNANKISLDVSSGAYAGNLSKINSPEINDVIFINNGGQRLRNSTNTQWVDVRSQIDISSVKSQLIQNRGVQDSVTSVNRSRAGLEDTATSVFTEDWANLINWVTPSTAGVQISANKLFSTGTGAGGSGANHSYGISEGESLRAVFTVNVPSQSSSGGAMIGVSKDAIGVAPANGGVNVFAVYFGPSGLAIWDGGSSTVPVEGNTLTAGDYIATVIVDETYISVSATKVDGSVECCGRKLRSGFVVNNLYVFNSDSRALAGLSIGRGSARKGIQTITPRTFGEGIAKGIQWTGDTTQSFRVYLPKNYDSRIPSPVAICFHGNGTDETQWSINNNMKIMQRALVDAGFIVLTCGLNASKTTWGNIASTNAYYQAYKYVKENYSIGSVVFYANSMGGIESLNALAENKIPCVAWVGTVPTYSLQNNYQNALFTGVVKAAYGIAADGSDYATRTKDRDPALMSPYTFRCLPMMILAPSDDTSVSKAENGDKLANAVKDISLEMVNVNVPNGGHSFSVESYKQQMVDFFKKYAQ